MQQGFSKHMQLNEFHLIPLRNVVDDLSEQMDVHSVLFPTGDRDGTKVALEIAQVAEFYMQHVDSGKLDRPFHHHIPWVATNEAFFVQLERLGPAHRRGKERLRRIIGKAMLYKVRWFCKGVSQARVMLGQSPHFSRGLARKARMPVEFNPSRKMA
jgi:hypothetical protein